MKVSVLNIKGKETGRQVELSKKVFEIDPSDHAVYLDVKQYLANQRQGNAKTKERACYNHFFKTLRHYFHSYINNCCFNSIYYNVLS